MQDLKVWNMITKHLNNEHSPEEKKKFFEWLDKNEKNKKIFNKIKGVWNDDELLVPENNPGFLSFRQRFTKHKIKDFIFKQAIGNLVGFTVGLWVTTMFSHYILEKRNLQNLFGLAGRKRVAVNDMPEWFQKCLAILLGFIALELINHFFQTKKHILIWEYFKEKYFYLINKQS